MQTAHFFGQRRLVAHRGRHTTEQCRHFGTSQGVAVDVVDEEQDVAAFVTEALGHRQTGQRDAQTVARGLVHLTEHHRHLVENVRVLHLVIEVVALAGTLTHAGKHRQTAVLLSDVVDELHHVHGLAHTGATEQTHLTALGERANQVDHLDAGFQQIDGRRQFVKLRGRLVDLAALIGADRTSFVDRPTQHVHDAAQSGLTDRHRDALARAVHSHTALEAVRRAECNGPDDAVAQLLLHFEGQTRFSGRAGRRTVEHQCVINLWHGVTRELNVHHRADTLNDLALTHRRIPNVECCFRGRLNRCRAADDLGEFLGNGGLAGLVVDQLQLADNVLCVVRRGFHRDHPRALL